jgi:tetratricopeptide (TPR) repeat protein
MALGMALAVAVLASAPLAFGDVTVEVTRIGDASHLEFSGSSSWNYSMKRDAEKGDRVTLRMPGLAPQTLLKLKSHSDGLVRSVAVNEKGLDGAAEVTFTMAPGVDFFDYMTDQPSRLVVDFFPGADKKKVSVNQEMKSEPAEKKLPLQLPAREKTGAESIPDKDGEKRKPSSDESSEDEDDESVIVHINPLGLTPEQLAELPQGKTKKVDGKRKPASPDLVLLPGKTEHMVSKAEEISAKKEYSHGIFDGGDPEFRRFTMKDYEVREDAVIASRANYYLPFPMLELGSPHLKSLLETPPTYEIVPAETQENKEARLLLTLFSNKRRAIFLKTAETFLKTYANSPYDEIIRYMMADVHFGFWRTDKSLADFEAAMGIYSHLADKYPKSPLTTRTLLLVGYAYLARGDSFSALKTFESFVRLKPDSKFTDQVKLSTAEAYLKLNRYDDALKILDEVEKTAKRPRDRQEASFRRGDVFLKKKSYDESIREYQASLKKYSDGGAKFPNVFYNIAEAQFIQAKYRDALDSYRQFLIKFPDHEHGGYAMTRMGELLGILGADEKRMNGAFMESNFRYRATPGAGIARMRLLANRMPEMKDKELGAALVEIKDIADQYSLHPERDDEKAKKEAEAKAKEAETKKVAAKEGEKEGGEKAKGGEHGGGEGRAVASVEKEADENEWAAFEVKPLLPGIEEFATLLLADGFTARHDYDRSLKDLVTYYQRYPQSQNKDRIVSRIGRNIAEGIGAAVDRGDFIEGLRRYSRYKDNWLKTVDRADVNEMIGRAYEQAGVFNDAENSYLDALKKLAEIKKSGKEKERSVFERLPKEESLQLHLAAVAAKNNDYLTAERHLKEIKNDGRLSDKEQIERAEVAADVAEARGQSDVAKKYLTELVAAWKGDAGLTSPLLIRLAKLHANTKNFKEADKELAKVIEMRKAGDVSDDMHAKALELRGDYFLARGKRGDAIRAYRGLLDEYESKRPLASVRYRIGQILYEDGDLKRAENEWSELKSADGNIWQRLADEQMKSAKWKSEYKKYLNRIPAAEELRAPQESKTR